MSASNFNTENNTYRKLIGNGSSYRIPRFQRDYSWTETEWDDLWNDILNTLAENGESAHYMGYLVLQSDDNKHFDVIDGQQRLTTLSLIVLAVLKNLQRLVDSGHNADGNSQRMKEIRSTYIGYLDSVSLISKSKLTLNRNNNSYFQNYLIPLQTLPQRGFKSSEHTLRKAFEWFDKKIQSMIKGLDDPGMQLAEFVENMSYKLFFTVINVTDELNAYKVFETLNARGVRLSSTDLLKNYLFSVLSKGQNNEHELNVLDERWEGIVSRLGAENFPVFVRTHWNSRKNFVRTADLFKTIRGKVNSREQVFTLLKEMEEDIDTYLALVAPEGATNYWQQKMIKYAKQLKMFNVRQLFALLLAAYRVLDKSDFEALLRCCVVIAFRYNVIGNLPTNEQEQVYCSVAKDINEQKRKTLTDILRGLKYIYPTDESFQQSFSEKALKTTGRNNKLVRYILCELEYQNNQQDYDMDSDSFTIEHVLPQNPDENWEHFTDEQVENFVYRIGNMTLLEKSKNNEIGNKPYSIKRVGYEKSIFGLTQKIYNHTEWNTQRIESRQKELAKLALTIWRISQLDEKS